ncbi:hypothetical protein EJ08DRAFT_30837 [Tothia fuscella]|uniref:Uncharacterized protein n=1 Tax=Tothia fuscella TaxID=1048955 RepID=A0A9P4NGK9_9PEZI|nr:hypothetical protein EJ08DRAFT_30837 [Tothia fuscella]
MGFDDYIIIMCTDWDNKCGKPNADDPRGRPIACYTNHTTSWWWTQSKITCCPPFFGLRDVQEIHDFYKAKPKKEIQNEKMEFFMSSGSAFLHEMMHIDAITQFMQKNGRRKIIDRKMKTGRARIYGPRNVARSAGDDENHGLPPETTTTNADSYAVFASSIHAENTFALDHILGPFGDVATDDQSEDSMSLYGNLTFDTSSNYLVETLPPLQQQMSKSYIPSCDGTPSYRPPVTQSFGQEKIQQFCRKVDKFVVTSTKDNYGPQAYGIDGKKDIGLLWLSYSWDNTCHPTAPGKATISQDECSRALSTALNGCNTDSVDKKWGGQVQGNCIAWNITTTADNNSTPPKNRVGTQPSKRSWFSTFL